MAHPNHVKTDKLPDIEIQKESGYQLSQIEKLLSKNT